MLFPKWPTSFMCAILTPVLYAYEKEKTSNISTKAKSLLLKYICSASNHLLFPRHGKIYGFVKTQTDTFNTPELTHGEENNTATIHSGRNHGMNRNSLRFAFVGKKGIKHNITLKNKRLARAMKQCSDIPGKELFQYYDEQGNQHAIDSGKVNAYIRKHTDDSFSTKDMRTWSGSVYALQGLLEAGPADSITMRKKNIVEVLDMVSSHLGNTRTVCKNYYVHPFILQLYENGEFEKHMKHSLSPGSWLNSEEKLLLRILKNTG